MSIIGIDLGTTNSLVAYYAEDGPHIIPNRFGENLTPSIVSVDDSGEIYIGKIAKERQITYPEHTAAVFKRHMGTKKEFILGKQTFLPEELSSLLIKKLKEDAEAFLGKEVKEAVISTPAYFNDAQRRATKNAGELAGLKVERIVSEPTAAAVAYGLHEKPKSAKFLIFDLGGGTFDISILEYAHNIMEVRAVAGDNYLGGEDFTEVLVEMFLQKHDLTLAQLSAQEEALLRKSAESAKKSFSSVREAAMRMLKEGELLTMTICREEFEKNCESILAKLRNPIIRALTDASIKLADIDNIVLVGGATKLPIVRNFVARLFGKLPASSINPDEVVAWGTAVQAAMKQRNQAIRELILTDVCPFTLGTSIAIERAKGIYQSGNFFPIIERNTIIPASRVERLYTLYDNQRVVNVKVLQGESRKSKDNIFLGELSVPMPLGPAGEEAVDVRYTYDINGILEVEATAASSGKTERIVIEKNPGTLTEEEIKERLENLEMLKIHPREKDKNKYLLEKGERLFQESIGLPRSQIANALNTFEAVLDQQDPLKIEEAAAELEAFYEIIEEWLD